MLRKPTEQRREMLKLVAGMWEAEENNKATEDEARVLLEKLRTVMAQIDAFNRRTPHGAGGVATMFLQTTCSGVAPSAKDLEDRQEVNKRLARLEGRPALVEQFGNGKAPLIGRELSNEDLAVMSILVGIGPGNYAALINGGALRNHTPAGVIHHETKAIASCRKSVDRARRA